jgi:hypothetical protein
LGLRAAACPGSGQPEDRIDMDELDVVQLHDIEFVHAQRSEAVFEALAAARWLLSGGVLVEFGLERGHGLAAGHQVGKFYRGPLALGEVVSLHPVD